MQTGPRYSKLTVKVGYKYKNSAYLLDVILHHLPSLLRYQRRFRPELYRNYGQHCRVRCARVFRGNIRCVQACSYHPYAASSMVAGL